MRFPRLSHRQFSLNRDKIAKAYAAGKEFARDAAPYCHSTQIRSAGGADGGVTGEGE